MGLLLVARIAEVLVAVVQVTTLEEVGVDTVAETHVLPASGMVEVEADRTTSTAPRLQLHNIACGTPLCTGPCRRIFRAATLSAMGSCSSACVLRRRTWFREHAPSALPMLTALET